MYIESENRIKLVSIIFGIYFIFRRTPYMIGLISEDTFGTYSDYEVFIFSMLAAISFFIVGFTFDPKTKSRTVFLLLGLGFISWAIGELTWSILSLISDEDPFPSIADFFYVVAYIPLIIGLITRVKMSYVAPDKVRIILLVVSALIFTVFTYIFAIHDILIDEEYTFIEKLVSFLYPFLDILLFIAVAILFSQFKGGKMESAWLLLMITMVAIVIADVIFIYESYQEIYSSALSISTDLYVLSYMLALISCLQFHKIITSKTPQG
jgi:hypothetical protein